MNTVADKTSTRSVASSFTASSAVRPAKKQESVTAASSKPQQNPPAEAQQPVATSSRKKDPSEAPSAAATSLSQRMQKLEDALRVEHKEHESTRSELQRTMREVELLRQLIETRSNQPAQRQQTPTSEIPSRDSLFEGRGK